MWVDVDLADSAQAPRVNAKSNEAQPGWTWTWTWTPAANLQTSDFFRWSRAPKSIFGVGDLDAGGVL